MKKDVDFIKRNITAGVNWTSKVIGFPEIAKKVDEVVWLRNVEDPEYVDEYRPPVWPEPYYPGFSCLWF